MNFLVKKMIKYNLYKSPTIKHAKGNITKLITTSHIDYNGFGELYFSDIKFNQIKGWQKHKKMNINLFLIEGIVKVVLAEIKNNNIIFEEILLSKKFYNHLFFRNDIFFAFKGISKKKSRLMNFSNIHHDPNETLSLDLSKIKYKW